VSSDTYEFGSRLWLAALHGVMAQRAIVFSARDPAFQSSICEVFLDAPRHLADERGRVAWSCLSRDGQADFRPVERDDVQFKVLAQYQAVAPIARYDTGGDPERLKELTSIAMSAAAAGQMTPVKGERFEEPVGLGFAHDVIARLTALWSELERGPSR
jgi:hypothetical protein